ncbi:MAG: serine/threonine-protein kinase [Myxococcota bacterium]
MNETRKRALERVGRPARKWRLDRLLDMGGMAAVYEATHRNGNRVAIKVLHRKYAAMSEAKVRFLREGYVANRVQHEGAVTVLDDDELDDGTPFIVMELLEGSSLETRLRVAGTLAPEEILFVADRVLGVLAAAHERGIIHRDIKPPNIFLTDDGGVKVLDFGLARVLEKDRSHSMTATGTIIGTASYMSPEQARGKRDLIDHRTDLFAVGAVLFRALTGRNVHLAENPMDRLLAAMSEPPPSLGSVREDVAPVLVDLVDRALAFQKTSRWESASAMRRRLREVYEEIAGQPIPASRSAPEIARWTSRPTEPVGGVASDEDFHVSVVFSELETGGDSIVVDLEDLESGHRTRRALVRQGDARRRGGTDDAPLSEVTVLELPDE